MDCPFFVQLNERSHSMKQILYKEYIQKKKDAYGQAAAALEVREDVSWDMLRSQINSGLQLGLSQEQVDMYSTAFYSYEQMEVIKFAIYARLSSEQLMKLCDPKLDAKDMLQVLLHTEASKGLTSAVNSIAAYMDELQEIKQEHAKEEKRLRDQLQEEEKKVRELEAEIEKLKTLQQKQEIRKESKPEKRKRFGKQIDSGSFDLGSYIINAHLSAEQMEVLRYAIEKEIDDKLIRQMIYQKLPAEQLRNMVAVILTKRSMEKTEKEETDGQ